MSCNTTNTDMQRFVDNMHTVDDIVNGSELTVITPGGQTRTTIAGYDALFQDAIDDIGWTIVDSFEDGATITSRNQVLRYADTGELFRWDGTLPKVVAPGSTPETTGGYGRIVWDFL